jgi:hypothetical protein
MYSALNCTILNKRIRWGGKVANRAAPGHAQSSIYLEMVALSTKSNLFKELDISISFHEKKDRSSIGLSLVHRMI